MNTKVYPADHTEVKGISVPEPPSQGWTAHLGTSYCRKYIQANRLSYSSRVFLLVQLNALVVDMNIKFRVKIQLRVMKKKKVMKKIFSNPSNILKRTSMIILFYLKKTNTAQQIKKKKRRGGR